MKSDWHSVQNYIHIGAVGNQSLHMVIKFKILFFFVTRLTEVQILCFSLLSKISFFLKKSLMCSTGIKFIFDDGKYFTVGMYNGFTGEFAIKLSSFHSFFVLHCCVLWTQKIHCLELILLSCGFNFSNYPNVWALVFFRMNKIYLMFYFFAGAVSTLQIFHL